MNTTDTKTDPVLELCSNTEWMREYSGLNLDAIDYAFADEAAVHLREQIWDRLDGNGFRVEPSRGQRSLCHGWNGANTFTHKLGPIGTFDDLTADQEAAIYSAIEDAIKATETAYAPTAGSVIADDEE